MKYIFKGDYVRVLFSINYKILNRKDDLKC